MTKKLVKRKNLTVNFAFLYFIHYLTSSLISGQRMTFLIRTSYTIQQRSLMFAAVPIVSIALQFFVGYLSDKFKTVKKIYVGLVAFSAILGFLFYSIQVQMFVFHFAITILSNSAIAALMDLSDVWVLESKGPSKDNYGFIRAFGSAGWSLGSFLIAQIVIMFGYQGVANVALLTNVLILAVVATIRDDKSEKLINDKIEAINLADVKAIFQSKAYLLVILVMFSLNFAASTANYMLVDKIIVLGGDEWHIGTRIMIAAGIEIPLLLIGDRIHKKLGSLKMILIAAAAYALQFMGYYFADTTTTIFIASAIQGISLPLFVVSIKYLLLELSPEHLKTTGQMAGPAIVNGLQGVLHPLVSAFLVSIFTIDAPFLLGFVFTIIAMLLCIPLFKEYNFFKTETSY